VRVTTSRKQQPTMPMPPPELLATPRPPFRSTEERVAWVLRTFADYPEYVAQYLAGGIDLR
jgi:hypothetical protein